MKKRKLHVHTEKRLADLITPVGLYLKIRDMSYQPFLLESSDYHGEKDSYSFVCFNPIASAEASEGKLSTRFNGDAATSAPEDMSQALWEFMQSFELSGEYPESLNGFFGYFSFDSIRYFETIQFDRPEPEITDIPEVRFTLFQHIIAINHYRNETLLIENLPEGEESKMDLLNDLLNNKNYMAYPFSIQGEIASNLNDAVYEQLVGKAKEHCQRGDVYQLVLSRRFAQPFHGDEFNVYRSLRSINPSPYLFYFDYGSYRIFGSSPESQIKIENGQAVIHPIAGTFKRTGNDAEDEAAAMALKEDPKENAEHVMLVDLARNDLSKSCENVEVKTYKEIQYYSHVIHLVSEVRGDIKAQSNPIQLLSESFPAGTLSGAPKYKALELIKQYEPNNRGIYGGAIGKVGFDGSANLAITIRTFFSRGNQLYFQAGAGIVNQSVEQKERQEVDNKLRALRKAIELAETL